MGGASGNMQRTLPFVNPVLRSLRLNVSTAFAAMQESICRSAFNCSPFNTGTIYISLQQVGCFQRTQIDLLQRNQLAGVVFSCLRPAKKTKSKYFSWYSSRPK